jgi:hypothetical protein
MAKYMGFYRQEGERTGLDRRFVVVKGADHNFSSMNWSDEVIRTTVDFVRGAAGGEDGAGSDVSRDSRVL